MPKDDYVLGHSEVELERLKLQAICLEPLTRRLIRDCGIKPGMRILDIGAGAGDVAMLVAQAVGPSGSVVGVDPEECAVEHAAQRAAEAGLRNVSFKVASDESLPSDPPFDAAFGRLVLIHQRDPVAMLRRARAAVRPGGVVAFLECAVHVDGHSLPPAPLSDAVSQSMFKFMRVAFPSPDVAGRLIPYFLDAGLSEPEAFWEAIVAGKEIHHRWFLATYGAVLPHMQRLGMVDPAAGDFETLSDRLIAEGSAAPRQYVSPPYVGAWGVRI